MKAEQLAGAVLRAVAAHAAGTGETLHEEVADADMDHDGMLSKDEFASFIMMCSVGLGEQAAQMTFAAFDSVGVGKIRNDELLKRASSINGLTVLDRKYEAYSKIPRRVVVLAASFSLGGLGFIAFVTVVRTCSRSSAYRRDSNSAATMAVVMPEDAPRELQLSPVSRWRRCAMRRAARYEALQMDFEPTEISGLE